MPFKHFVKIILTTVLLLLPTVSEAASGIQVTNDAVMIPDGSTVSVILESSLPTGWAVNSSAPVILKVEKLRPVCRILATADFDPSKQSWVIHVEKMECGADSRNIRGITFGGNFISTAASPLKVLFTKSAEIPRANHLKPD